MRQAADNARLAIQSVLRTQREPPANGQLSPMIEESEPRSGLAFNFRTALLFATRAYQDACYQYNTCQLQRHGDDADAFVRYFLLRRADPTILVAKFDWGRQPRERGVHLEDADGPNVSHMCVQVHTLAAAIGMDRVDQVSKPMGTSQKPLSQTFANLEPFAFSWCHLSWLAHSILGISRPSSKQNCG